MSVVGYCRNLYNNLCPCFVCSKKFSLDNGVEDLLTHICFTHRIIIGNIDQIADFRKYMEYYMKRFKETSLDTFTKEIVIEIPEKDSEQREQKYYLLGNSLSEDVMLRKSLHSERLKAAQKQQKKDLSNKLFVRHCFYCLQTTRVTNAQLINHLRCHGFQLGHPEKLVYIEKFVEAIEVTFRTLRCLFCNMKFDSCRALITHMEEKNHMKIHPNDRFYDQFYMINYVEFGKTWMDFLKEKNKTESDHDSSVDDDKDWSSWGTEPESIMCLFCNHICRSWDGTLLHMIVSHNFDLKSNISQFIFYQKVKLVNFIRRKVLSNQCLNCDAEFGNQNELTSHLEKSKHIFIPPQDIWDRSDYYICTMENDMFLYHLEDQDDIEEENTNVLNFREASPIFIHYDMENSESESACSSISSEICFDSNHDSASITDSIIEGDICNSVEGEEDSPIKEFEEKIKVAFENSAKIDIPIKENVEFAKRRIGIENKQPADLYRATRELFMPIHETSGVNHVGAGDSVKMIFVDKDSGTKSFHEFGDGLEDSKEKKIIDPCL